MNDRKEALLVLADGTVFWGRGIGATGRAVGEVCFNTAITGYQEILTDPSYAGQIITFTFPHIGNVGTNEDDIETVNMAATPGARGVVLHTAITEPSNYRATRHLDQWLKANGYRIPDGAPAVLQSYIKQGMFFFVAKVDVQEQKRLGYTFLRPIQVAYESPKFMLPIRLGMVNAQGPQEMFVFTLTRAGRAEVTNYRTVRVPTDLDIPEFVKPEFPEFYRTLFTRVYEKEGKDAVFLEYCWNIIPNQPSCDPCTAPYLRPEELRTLGAFWISTASPYPGAAVLTRLHIRYDKEHFPEDFQFQITGDRQNWQARYVLHHAYAGTDECPELVRYHRSLWNRRRKEATNYRELTGVDFIDIRKRMGVAENWSTSYETASWWERLWWK